jgi:ribonuclease HI
LIQENIVIHYSWGLGAASNNIVEAYALLQGLSITKEWNITKLVVFGDSMMVVKRSPKELNLEAIFSIV